MRSEWRIWPDEVRVSWPVAGGTGHVLFPFTGDRVEHDDGTITPREFTYVEFPADKRLPYMVLECTLDGVDLAAQIKSVMVVQQDQHRDVRRVDLRDLRLEDALEAAFAKVTRRASIVVAEPANPIESLRADTQATDPVKTLRGLRRQDRRKLSEPVLDDQFQAVLVVVGEEGSFDGLAGVVVVPDRGGQGEDAL